MASSLTMASVGMQDPQGLEFMNPPRGPLWQYSDGQSTTFGEQARHMRRRMGWHAICLPRTCSTAVCFDSAFGQGVPDRDPKCLVDAGGDPPKNMLRIYENWGAVTSDQLSLHTLQGNYSQLGP